MSTTTKRVLPADVYDALEMSALVYGGIGACAWVTDDSPGFGSEPTDIPYCSIGHVYACEGRRGEMREAMDVAGLSFMANDAAVIAINGRHGKDDYARVSFADWCAELGVERGA